MPLLLGRELPHSQLIFPSKTWFFGIYLKFQWQKSLKNQYLPHSESKSYPRKFIKFCSPRSFQQPKAHSNSSEIFSCDLIYFSVKKSFNIQELLHRKSKCRGTKPMHPSSSRAFQGRQEHDLKHPSWVALITTKQNNLPSFINRFCVYIFYLFYIWIHPFCNEIFILINIKIKEVFYIWFFNLEINNLIIFI